MLREDPRAQVQILARWSAPGQTLRKFANVLGIGKRSLIVEMDDPLEEGSAVSISFVVPGTSERVALDCTMGAPTAVNGLMRYVVIEREQPEIDRFVEKRLGARREP